MTAAMRASAIISQCGRYRYELTRIGDDTKPLLEWIMLNPSTADANINDPTIRRCIDFAKRWGFGGIVVRNLYAMRATNPAELCNADDPIGPENRTYLAADNAAATVVAWGAHPAAAGWWNGYPYAWQPVVIRRRTTLLCLGRTKSGAPKHPLYVPADTIPTPWEPAP